MSDRPLQLHPTASAQGAHTGHLELTTLQQEGLSQREELPKGQAWGVVQGDDVGS